MTKPCMSIRQKFWECTPRCFTGVTVTVTVFAGGAGAVVVAVTVCAGGAGAVVVVVTVCAGGAGAVAVTTKKKEISQ